MDRILDMFSFLPEPDSFTLLESFPLNLRFPFWKGQQLFRTFSFLLKIYLSSVSSQSVVPFGAPFDPGIFWSSVFLGFSWPSFPLPQSLGLTECEIVF